ncbi:MAG: extracellular solute-binding protein [Chloroflexi bacterium]|nr:extracellular solute-binding protein [Chloroflexota bacterium]
MAEAKKEGRVTIYNILGQEPRIAISQAFMAKFGIEAEFASFSRAVEVMAKVQAENRAGLFLADLFFVGTSTNIASMKPAGLLGAMEPLLMLPEVTDPRTWTGGKFPFVDKDKQVIAISAVTRRNIVHNTDFIKKGEITSYKDMLKPQYKGRISLNDPTISGSGAAFLAFLALRVWNLDEASEFLTRLVRQQEAVIQRDQRQQVEWIARGRLAIGLAPHPETLVEFVGAGAPLNVATMKEGTYGIAGTGAFSVPDKFAHPNAAKVFVNWLLTREGQTVFARSYGSPSMRIDVSAEGIDPMFLQQPEEKVFFDDEEMILFRARVQDIAKEIIDNAMRR